MTKNARLTNKERLERAYRLHEDFRQNAVHHVYAGLIHRINVAVRNGDAERTQRLRAALLCIEAEYPRECEAYSAQFNQDTAA